MSVEASPKPWTMSIDCGGANGDSVKIVDARGGVVCLMKAAGGRKLGNAAEIVEAVNGRIDRNVLDLPNCPSCGKSKEDFRRRSTCGMGGCPWGGDF